MKKFIWNEKEPRVAYDILTTNKELDRMGLPNIKNYYYASLLDQIKFWYATPNDKLWVRIEKEFTKGHDLYALSVAKHII